MTDNKKLVLGLDGGPRKGWNTAAMVGAALEGAREAGAETRLVRLFELGHSGCASCFACKRKGHYLDGLCAVKDGLTPVLEELRGATGVVMGSPIYIGDVTASFRAFFERYVYSNINYDTENRSVMKRGPAYVLLYTMNVPESGFAQRRYDVLLESHAGYLRMMNAASVEQLTALDTLQFRDYSAYHAPMFDEGHKRKVRAEAFPDDLAKARAAGARLVTG
jgi:multimeric flavodoxin WrbA